MHATTGRTELEKMVNGEIFLSPDPELLAIGNRARTLTRALNETPRENREPRMAILKDLLGRIGGSWIESPFSVDYGLNVEIGETSFVNMNCTFLDSAKITIGDRSMLGPGVQLITAAHPVNPADRYFSHPADPDFPFRVAGFAEPITIGNDCWIGAGAIILPGVTIGDGTTIGAGSVVTRSIPSRVVAAGNPCRVLRRIDAPVERAA
jgi:maltose O-acetyltransferase